MIKYYDNQVFFICKVPKIREYETGIDDRVERLLKLLYKYPLISEIICTDPQIKPISEESMNFIISFLRIDMLH